MHSPARTRTDLETAARSLRRRHRRFGALLAALVALVSIGLATGVALAHASTTRLATGVVVIETKLGYQDGAAAGTGMVLTPAGEILTNNHVIRSATSIRIVVPNTGRTYAATVVGYDVKDDVAVLQATGASGLQTVTTSSSKLSLGTQGDRARQCRRYRQAHLRDAARSPRSAARWWSETIRAEPCGSPAWSARTRPCSRATPADRS